MLNQIIKFILKPIHPSWCFYALVWGIISGLVLSLVTETALIRELYWLIFALFVTLLTLRHSCPATLLIIFLAGIIIGNFRISHDLVSQEILKDYYNQTVLISGSLSEDPDGNKVRLTHLQLYHSDDPESVKFTEIPGTLYVTLSGDNNLERSDRLTLQGKLSAGFGTFIGNMFRPKIISISRPSPGDIFARLKHWFSNQVRLFVPSPEVDLGLGYLMGEKTGLSEEFSEALRAVGMTHVVVASGAHLAILTGAAKKIFGKISKFASLLFSLLMILFFVLIVGPTPSMTRAALVASLSILTGYIGRKFTPFRLISFVAMLTLLINPSHFLNLGWQLSFASFFGILILAPRLQKSFYGGKSPPWLASMLITSLATSLTCAPILIYSFGTISFLSFVANLIILPTLPYAMLGMLLVGLASPVGFAACLLAKPTTWLLDLHIWLVNFLSEQSSFILEIPIGDPRIYLLYLPTALYLILPSIYKYHHRRRQFAREHATQKI